MSEVYPDEAAQHDAVVALARDLWEARRAEEIAADVSNDDLPRWETMSDQSHERFRRQAQRLLARYAIAARPAEVLPLQPVDGVNPRAVPLDPRLRYIVSIAFADRDWLDREIVKMAHENVLRIVADLAAAGVVATPLLLLPGETLAVHAFAPSEPQRGT